MGVYNLSGGCLTWDFTESNKSDESRIHNPLTYNRNNLAETAENKSFHDSLSLCLKRVHVPQRDN